ncbi:hypothetical protein AKO1_009962 [Acrasis kona]|uniref:Uncharacterized protein n=1 Tax=Acrasis kona TaxID=1008807 RepID=A0AAW2ZN04_9EUKA
MQVRQYFVEQELLSEKVKEGTGTFLNLVRAMSDPSFDVQQEDKLSPSKWLVFPPQTARIGVFGCLVAIDPQTKPSVLPLCGLDRRKKNINRMLRPYTCQLSIPYE